RGCGADEGQHLVGESLHLLVLRAELQEQQVDAGALELLNALGDLFRRAGQTRAQAAIRHRVVLEADALLELRVADPLLIIRVPARALTHIGDARDFAPRLRLRRSHDDVTGAAERHRRVSERAAPLAHLRDLPSDDLRWISVREPRVALVGDER